MIVHGTVGKNLQEILQASGLCNTVEVDDSDDGGRKAQCQCTDSPKQQLFIHDFEVNKPSERS